VALGLGESMRRREFITVLGGAVAFWPLAARAQQTKLPTVGVLVSAAPDDWSSRVETFRQGLSEAGFTEGNNVTLLYRYAEYHYERLPAMALDLVRQNVEVMLASGGDTPIQAAMAATSTIPIVFTSGNDPVMAGYVKSLNRPGGNVTGVTFLGSSLEAKRLELLHEIDLKAASVAVLIGSANARTENDTREIEEAAKSLGLNARFVRIESEDDIIPAFRDIAAHREDAIHIVTDPFFAARERTLAALAATAALPASFNTRGFAAAGGLFSYGADSTSAYRDAGAYVGRILKGAMPAELPVQESTKIELVINLKAAKKLGLTVPLPLLGRADEIIE
jgi:putative tryptophan/tyrosine transport system substrate-binding protein